MSLKTESEVHGVTGESSAWYQAFVSWSNGSGWSYEALTMRPPARFWIGLVLHSSRNAARRDGFLHERENAFTFVILLAAKGGDDYYCVANPGRTQVFRSAFGCH